MRLGVQRLELGLAMVASAYNPKPSSSIFSGVPAFVQLIDFYDENYISMLTQAMDTALSGFEQRVRKEAKAVWGDLADSISIDFNPSTFEVTYSAPAEAELLEYGSDTESPKAVLRNAAMAASQELPNKVAAIMAGKK